MVRLGILLIASVMCAPAALAVDREFNDIVRALSDEFRTKPMRIPFFGLVNAFTFVARPAGTSHVDLAVFEHLNNTGRDGLDLQEMVRRTVGRGWTPFVQVHSRRNNELVLVYVRMEGRNCRLLVTSIERDEATVVQLRLNPDGLQRWIAAPLESARSNRGNRSNYGDE